MSCSPLCRSHIPLGPAISIMHPPLPAPMLPVDRVPLSWVLTRHIYHQPNFISSRRAAICQGTTHSPDQDRLQTMSFSVR